MISEAVEGELRRAPGQDFTAADFVDRVAAVHVVNTIRSILEHSPTLAAMVQQGAIGIVGAMYDVSTGRVHFLEHDRHGIEPGPSTADSPKLERPPARA